LGARAEHDAADARGGIGEDLDDRGLTAKDGDSPDHAASDDDGGKPLRPVDAPAVDREPAGEAVPVPGHDLGAQGALGESLAERRYGPEPEILRLERFLPELAEPQRDGLGAQAGHLGAEVLPVKVAGP